MSEVKDLPELGEYLVMLPFYMRLMRHRTIKGHVMYVHHGELVDAMLEWLICQNDQTWEALIDAYGGEDGFNRVTRAIVTSMSKGKRMKKGETWDYA